MWSARARQFLESYSLRQTYSDALNPAITAGLSHEPSFADVIPKNEPTPEEGEHPQETGAFCVSVASAVNRVNQIKLRKIS